jgi:hypothetical protein
LGTVKRVSGAGEKKILPRFIDRIATCGMLVRIRSQAIVFAIWFLSGVDPHP